MLEKLAEFIEQTVGEDIDFLVFPSEKPEFGHYSTNAAFRSAGKFKRPVLETAKELAEKIFQEDKKRFFEKIEVAKPGFINFWLSQKALQSELKEILAKKEKYGALKAKKKLKINVEFVSANPTGPLTMANGRGGFYGDVLANVLEKAGHKVTREYIINDAGNQIKLLGESILAAQGKIREKEEYYKGKYIKDIAKNLRLKSSDGEKIGKAAAKILLKEIKASLKKAGIRHDVWFSEDSNLHKTGELKKTLEFLSKKRLVEEKDGAKWLALSGVEGLNDAVLVKSDGDPTYFLADLAYHYDKFIKRKFDLAIDIWGADHHGYAARMKKGIEAIGVNPNRLKIIITQLVRLVGAGKEIKMSKRKGEFVTMDELLKEVGADAARFFFLMHSPDTHMDFDLELAKKRSMKNPVYYAQYAFVRCKGILRKAQIAKRKAKSEDLNLLTADSELRLIQELIKWPDVMKQTAEDYQAIRLTKYALELARAFHNFYEKERVIGAENEPLAKARLALVSAAKYVLGGLFETIGIRRLDRM